MADLRPLGRTDLRVSAIGLGCWQFSGGRGIAGSYWPALDPETTRAVVQRSLEHGINWFDTAEVYGDGVSEKALSDALFAAQASVGSVVVATKWWPLLRTSPSILDSFRNREDALRPYPVDLHQAHHAAALSPVEAVVRTLAQLVQRRRIRALGVSNYNAAQVERALSVLDEVDVPLASNQVKFSLLDRRIERNGVLDVCRRHDVAILAYSPLEQGILTGSYHDDPTRLAALPWTRRVMPRWRSATLRRTAPVIDELRAIAERLQATPAQVALAWVTQVHGDRVFAIAGARSPEQAESNAKAMQLRLSSDDRSRLDRVSRPFVERPVG
jgi:aryl-alcohol dehydrogenase-like predicted oxidoreductase